MIRSIDSSSSTEPSAQPAQVQPAPGSSTGKTFADVQAAAITREKTAAGGKARIDVPEGETWAPVNRDAHFARIISGPRAGQYINLTDGDRRGQTFTIERQNGKTLHVYGSGSSQQSIQATADVGAHAKGVKKAAERIPADRPPSTETWAPVDGHNHYADILSGPRNGLFVNISGGVRDGMAFQIVKHGAKTFHVYGSGKTRQVIEIRQHKAAASTTTPATGSATGSTTGSATATTTNAATQPTGGVTPASGSTSTAQ